MYRTLTAALFLSAASKPAATAAAAAVMMTYKCVKKSQVRTGFDMGSDKASILQVGTVITALDTRVNEGGALR